MRGSARPAIFRRALSQASRVLHRLFVRPEACRTAMDDFLRNLAKGYTAEQLSAMMKAPKSTPPRPARRNRRQVPRRTPRPQPSVSHAARAAPRSAPPTARAAPRSAPPAPPPAAAPSQLPSDTEKRLARLETAVFIKHKQRDESVQRRLEVVASSTKELQRKSDDQHARVVALERSDKSRARVAASEAAHVRALTTRVGELDQRVGDQVQQAKSLHEQTAARMERGLSRLAAMQRKQEQLGREQQQIASSLQSLPASLELSGGRARALSSTARRPSERERPTKLAPPSAQPAAPLSQPQPQPPLLPPSQLPPPLQPLPRKCAAAFQPASSKPVAARPRSVPTSSTSSARVTPSYRRPRMNPPAPPPQPRPASLPRDAEGEPYDGCAAFLSRQEPLVRRPRVQTMCESVTGFTGSLRRSAPARRSGARSLPLSRPTSAPSGLSREAVSYECDDVPRVTTIGVSSSSRGAHERSSTSCRTAADPQEDPSMPSCDPTGALRERYMMAFGSPLSP